MVRARMLGIVFGFDYTTSERQSALVPNVHPHLHIHCTATPSFCREVKLVCRPSHFLLPKRQQ